MGKLIPARILESDIAWARALYERLGLSEQEIADRMVARGLEQATADMVEKWARRHKWVRGFQSAVISRTQLELAKAMTEREAFAGKRDEETGKELRTSEAQLLEDLRELYPKDAEEFELARQKLISSGVWSEDQMDAWIRTAAMDRANKILAHRAEWAQMDELRNYSVVFAYAYMQAATSEASDKRVVNALHDAAKKAAELVAMHIKMLADKQKSEADAYHLHVETKGGEGTFEQRLEELARMTKREEM